MQQMAFHCHFTRKRSLGSLYPVYKKKKPLQDNSISQFTPSSRQTVLCN